PAAERRCPPHQRWEAPQRRSHPGCCATAATRRRSLPCCPRPRGATQQHRSDQPSEGGGAGVPAIDVVVASSQPSPDSVPFLAGCRSPLVIRRLGQLARWPSTVSSAGVSTGRTIRVSIISPTVTAKAI